MLVFAANLTLTTSESASAITVNLVDANNQSFNLAAEDVRAVPNSDFAQIKFRLPDTIAAGTCTVKVRKGSGPFGNSATFRIAP